jgi:Flp pilus assembly pilin Flp
VRRSAIVALFARFLKDESGAAALEYAHVVMLLAMVALARLRDVAASFVRRDRDG